MNSIWDWGFLDGCFSNTGIKVSDLDGIVERNGRFLVFETKSPGADIPTGQAIMFESMVATGLFNVMLIWGKPSTPERIRIYTPHNPEGLELEATSDMVQAIVKGWFKDINKRKIPYD